MKKEMPFVESKRKVDASELRSTLEEYKKGLFVANSEREPIDEDVISTAYIEFYPGTWDGETFWSEESMCLKYDLFVPEAVDDFFKVIDMDVYDTSGVKIDAVAWNKARAACNDAGGELLDVFNILDPWCSETINKYGNVTLIGI